MATLRKHRLFPRPIDFASPSRYTLGVLLRRFRMFVKRSAMFLLALPLMAASVRIYQTNSAGDAVDIIDPATYKIIGHSRDDT